MAGNITSIAKHILAQIANSFEQADETELGQLIPAMTQAKRIFLTGQGRTGLIAKAFAMRLAHLGFDAYVVGETITPAIAAGDLLIAASCTGGSQVTLTHVKLAKQAGAKVLAIVGAKDSRLAQVSDEVVVLPVQGEGQPQAELKQFGGSLFEQVLLVYFDALAAALKEKLGVTDEDMWSRHANLG